MSKPIRISNRLAINFTKLSSKEISLLIDECVKELAKRMDTLSNNPTKEEV